MGRNTGGHRLFFEGSVKKAEIIVDKQQLNLLNQVDDKLWASLVEQCNAYILSSISNSDCKAFLLSESSLFIWQDRLLILTCGVTQLVNSVEFFVKHFGMDAIEQVTYQRKNEYYAQAQPSCFGDDIKRLSQSMAGKAYRFGELDSHHNYLFHLNNDFQAHHSDVSYELLIYQICPQASKYLTQEKLSTQQIREFLSIDEILPEFEIDDFVFEPYGYSLNAIKGKQYLTIHITPQPDGSYISFESNFDLFALTPQLLTLLKPLSFDFMSFNETNFASKTADLIPKNYVSKSLVNTKLSNGYQVNFANYILPATSFSGAKELDIDSDNHAL